MGEVESGEEVTDSIREQQADYPSIFWQGLPLAL